MSVAYRIQNVAGLFSEGVESGAEPTPQRLRATRERLFGETALARMSRLARASAGLLASRCLVGLPAYLEVMIRDRAVAAACLPDASGAMARPEGFCGAALDLSPAAMLQAYAQGLHARAPMGPAGWWSPRRRLVRDLEASAPLAPAPSAEFDTDCDAIVARCAQAAALRDPLAALAPALKHAHARLLDRGHAHSWRVEGAEGYGVVVAGFFIVLGLAGGREASRRAVAALEAELRQRPFRTLDLTFVREAIDADIGVEMEREDYLRQLETSPDGDRALRWR